MHIYTHTRASPLKNLVYYMQNQTVQQAQVKRNILIEWHLELRFEPF